MLIRDNNAQQMEQRRSYRVYLNAIALKDGGTCVHCLGPTGVLSNKLRESTPLVGTLLNFEMNVALSKGLIDSPAA